VLDAIDFTPKPEGAVSLGIDTLAPRLVEKVRSAAAARLKPTLRLAERVRARTGRAPAAPAARALLDTKGGSVLLFAKA